MLTAMRPALALAALALACDPGPAPDLALDTGRTCERLALEVVDPAVLPGWDVRQMIVEDPTGTNAWTVAVDPEGAARLQPWPEGQGRALADTAVQLLAGPSAGQTWLLRDGPDGAQVWRLGLARSGEVREGPTTAFPDVGPWTRRLVFVGGAPYLLAAPVSAPASQIELQIAALDPETLAPGPASAIEFWRTCPEDQAPEVVCPEPAYDQIDRVELLTQTEATGTGGAALMIGLHAVSQTDPQSAEGLYHTVLSTLELRSAGPDRPPTAIRRDPLVWVAPTSLELDPAQIVFDSANYYMQVGTIEPPTSDRPQSTRDYLVRAPRVAGDLGGRGEIFAYVERKYGSHLLQIGDQAALGQYHGSEWHIAPIVRATVDVETVIELDIGEGTRAAAAGRGSFLLRPADGPAQRAATACTDE
jgi:hypothetical protein